MRCISHDSLGGTWQRRTAVTGLTSDTFSVSKSRTDMCCISPPITGCFFLLVYHVLILQYGAVQYTAAHYSSDISPSGSNQVSLCAHAHPHTQVMLTQLERVLFGTVAGKPVMT